MRGGGVGGSGEGSSIIFVLGPKETFTDFLEKMCIETGQVWKKFFIIEPNVILFS